MSGNASLGGRASAVEESEQRSEISVMSLGNQISGNKRFPDFWKIMDEVKEELPNT